ncbi:hypothetical protein LOD99_14425 [Oopsacas minuta]|uniref:AIG1-type G domain-containing protein n=1 Tax=Oopsacas minuta TaxID=111878 RepID=A0AAV7KHL1_9METZ|nr:hypothetical protein LOD99_14425 [Oopsacas minuta]
MFKSIKSILGGRVHENGERSFILIGQVSDGKSTFGNLLFGGGDDGPFRTHTGRDAFGLTQEQMGMLTQVNRRVIDGGIDEDQRLNFQIIDQPGLSDPNFEIQDHAKNLIKCIKTSHIEMSVTFILVFNLNSPYISQSTFNDILQLADLLALSSYSLFGNAVIVFTHVDQLGDVDYEEKLNEKLKDTKWIGLQIILNLVENRYIFVNGLDKHDDNRNRILKLLFHLSKPTLRIILHGNNNFPHEEMQDLLGITGNCSFDHEKYRLEINFTDDLDVFEPNTPLDLEREIGTTVDQSIALLNVRENLRRNVALSRIVSKSNSRYIWVEDNPRQNYKTIINRVIEQCLEVKYYCEGRDFIDGSVIREMNRLERELRKFKQISKGSPKKKISHKEELLDQVWPIQRVSEMKYSDIMTRTLFSTKSGVISGRMAMFYLRKMKPNISNKLISELFPNPDETVSKEDFIRRLIESNVGKYIDIPNRKSTIRDPLLSLQ